MNGIQEENPAKSLRKKDKKKKKKEPRGDEEEIKQ